MQTELSTTKFSHLVHPRYSCRTSFELHRSQFRFIYISTTTTITFTSHPSTMSIIDTQSGSPLSTFLCIEIIEASFKIIDKAFKAIQNIAQGDGYAVKKHQRYCENNAGKVHYRPVVPCYKAGAPVATI